MPVTGNDLAERTVRGALRALAEMLAVVDPAAYTSALRVHKRAMELARDVDITTGVALDLAASIGSIGSIGLPAEVQRRIQNGDPLNADDARLLGALPRMTDRLLAPIPGIENVRAILLLRDRQTLPPPWLDTFGETQVDELRRAAAVLRICSGFDVLQNRGYSTAETLGLLRAHATLGERALVDRLAELQSRDTPRIEVRSLPLTRLRAGMTIAEPVHTHAGQLLVARGFEINDAFLARVKNFRRGQIREPIQVFLPRVTESGQSDAPDGRNGTCSQPVGAQPGDQHLRVDA